MTWPPSSTTTMTTPTPLARAAVSAAAAILVAASNDSVFLSMVCADPVAASRPSRATPHATPSAVLIDRLPSRRRPVTLMALGIGSQDALQELTDALLHFLRHGDLPGFCSQRPGPLVGVQVGLARLASRQVAVELGGQLLAEDRFNVVGQKGYRPLAGQMLASRLMGIHGSAR